jgi:hypothetical protein
MIWKEQLLPKHPMANAVNYTLSQWDALSVFTTDGSREDAARRSSTRRGSTPSSRTMVKSSE